MMQSYNNPFLTQPEDMAADLRYLLSTGMNVRVSFTKKDGTSTTRMVTTNQSRIPETRLPQYKRQTSFDLIHAFDTDKKDWICIGVNRINNIQINVDS